MLFFPFPRQSIFYSPHNSSTSSLSFFSHSENFSLIFLFSLYLSLFCLITAGRAKDKQTFENKPLVIAKPIVLNDNKIQTVTESDALESKFEKIALNQTPASG